VSVGRHHARPNSYLGLAKISPIAANSEVLILNFKVRFHHFFVNYITTISLSQHEASYLTCGIFRRPRIAMANVSGLAGRAVQTTNLDHDTSTSDAPTHHGHGTPSERSRSHLESVWRPG
jgi:hypothetical protein